MCAFLNPARAPRRSSLTTVPRLVARVLLLLALAGPSLAQTPRAPTFLRQPVDATAGEGYWASFVAAASAVPTGTYQWQRKIAGSADWADLSESAPFSGVSSSFLSITPVAPSMNGDQYRLVATNTVGTAFSNAATLTVVASSPGFTTMPNSQDVAPGSNVQFSAAVIGTPPFMYQWLKNGVEIPGATATTLALANVQLADEANYSVRVTNPVSTVTSGAGRLQVVFPPVITTQPPTLLTRFVGQSVGFSAWASSKVTPTYQWLRNGEPVPGATSNILSIPAVQPSDDGLYRLRVTNVGGSVISEATELTVVPQPVPAITPGTSGGNTIPLPWGGNATLTTTILSLSNCTYQWYRDGQALPGATQATLTLTNGGIADFAEYILAATSPSGTALSPTFRVVPGPSSTTPAHHWIDAREVDGVIYFTFASAPRILRFDLASNAWLTPWNLSAAPTAIAFAPDFIYLATGSGVSRYNRDLTSPTQIYSSTTPIRALGIRGSTLVIVTVGSGSTVITCDRQTGQPIAQRSYDWLTSDFIFEPTFGVMIGRVGQTSSDCAPKYVPINVDGTIGALLEKGERETRAFGRIWSLVPGVLEAQFSGQVQRTNDQQYVGSFGCGTDDAIEHPGGYYALQAGYLREFDAQFRETRARRLDFHGERLWRRGDALLIFGQPTNGDASPSLTQLAPTDLVAPSIPAPVDPAGVTMPSPIIDVDDSGTVHIFSRLHRTVFRWSATTGSYGTGVGIPVFPNFYALDAARQRLYFETNNHQLVRLSLSGAANALEPFTNTTHVMTAVASADRDVAIGTHAGEFYNDNPYGHRLLSETSELLGTSSQFEYERSTGYTWSSALRRLYFPYLIQGGGILSIRFAADGGYEFGSDLSISGDASGQEPYRVSPDGTWLSSGWGRIIRAATLKSVGTLPRTHVDAVWSEDHVHTLRPSLAGTIVESWSVPSLQLAQSTTLPGVPLRILRLKSDRLLVVTAQNGVPSFHVLDATTLAPIAATDRSAPPQILRQSSDLAGEVGGRASFWVETTGGVLPSYRWQMRTADSRVWIDVVDDGNFSGSQTARLAIANLRPEHAGARFRAIITNPGGTVTTDPEGLTVSGLAGVTQIATNGAQFAFVRADGTAWAMGTNTDYALGDGTDITRSAPVQIATDVAHVTVSLGSISLRKTDGTLWLTGAKGNEALFAPGQGGLKNIPRQLALDALDARWNSAAAHVLDVRGKLWRSAATYDGRIGSTTSTPVAPQILRYAIGSIHGSYSPAFVTADGELWIGDESPKRIDGDVVSVAIGAHVVYLKRDGTAWTFGTNSSGQLGDGTTTRRDTPQQVATDVKAVAASTYHTVLLKTDGTVWAAGSGSSYQFGNGSTASLLSFTLIARDAIDIAIGDTFSALLRADGSVWIAGDFHSPTRRYWARWLEGFTAPLPAAPQSVRVESLYEGALLHWTPVVGSLGYELWRGTNADFASAALLAGNVRMPWFVDTNAPRGTDHYYFIRARTLAGTTATAEPVIGHIHPGQAPVITKQPTDVTTPAPLILTVEASGFPRPTFQWQEMPPGKTAWQNSSGDIGDVGTTSAQLTVSGQFYWQNRSGTRFRCLVTNPIGQAISSEATITVVVQPPTFANHPQGGVLPLGGTLNLRVGSYYTSPVYQWRKDGVAIPGATQSELVLYGTPAAAGSYTAVLTVLGVSTESQPAVITVGPSPGVVGLGAGDDFSVLVMADGNLRAMGENRDYQTGLGTVRRYDPPGNGYASSALVGVSSGPRHSLFVFRGGGLSGGGNNLSGQSLDGYGVVGTRYVHAVAAAAGGFHSLYLDSDGAAWAWGANINGQLGNGTTTDRSAPFKVLSPVAAISAGDWHSLFLKPDGTLWATGNNDYGQLGLGNIVSRSTPALVATSVRAICAGNHHSLFLKTDRTLWAMGLNVAGELGTASPVGQRAESPVQIASDVVEFSTGQAHTAYITGDRKLWVLGQNDRGQLGTGDTTSRTEPYLLATDAVLVACGQAHTLFTDSTGAVWVVGSNSSGQLGLGRTDAQILRPVRIWESTLTPPSATTYVSATDGTLADFVRVTWMGVAGATSYEVWRSTSPIENSATLYAADVRTCLFHDTDAAADAVYYYWIRPRNSAGLAPFGVGDAGLRTAKTGLPTISYGPNDVTAGYATVATFSVSSGGSYQWRKNGVAIPGATYSTLTLTNLKITDEGFYDVVVTNAVGSIVSKPARLTLIRTAQGITLPTIPTLTFTRTPFALGPATSSAGLPVVYRILSGPATVTGNLVTLTGPGSVIYLASQAGDEFNEPVETMPQRFEVAPASVTFDLSGLLQIYNGQPKSATVTPANDAVALTYDGSATPPINAGRYTVVATVNDPTARGSRVGLLTILPASQSIVAFTAPAKIRDDVPFTLSATASSGLPVAFGVDFGPGSIVGATLTPSGMGNIQIRAQQPGDTNYDASPAVFRTIKAVETFTSWRASHFAANELLDAAISGPNADADHDGHTNLVEYALGTDPLTPEVFSAPTLNVEIDSSATLWEYLYTRAPDRLDLTYNVERSANLVDWTDADIVHEPTDTADHWRARYAPPQPTPAIFFRLKVTRQ